MKMNGTKRHILVRINYRLNVIVDVVKLVSRQITGLLHNFIIGITVSFRNCIFYYVHIISVIDLGKWSMLASIKTSSGSLNHGVNIILFGYVRVLQRT